MLRLDVKAAKWDKVSNSFKSYGKRKVGVNIVPVLVNPHTWEVRWVKGKEPCGWETFWN